jgi:predicted phage gp36 major capsid-like protein
MAAPNRPAWTGRPNGQHGAESETMGSQRESKAQPVEASLKSTYRALLVRGLEPGEAANLTAFLHGLPSAGFHWTLPEVEAIVRRRLEHAAGARAAATAGPLSSRIGRSTIHDRRGSGAGFMHAVDPPRP